MTITLAELVARWETDEGKPYKGKLIDWSSYDGDGTEPPSNIGCMCAQGQALHLLGGWTPYQLSTTCTGNADRATAELLGISTAHSIFLRTINDGMAGAPAIVITNPARLIGDQGHAVLAFWRHLDRMNKKDWRTMIRTAAFFPSARTPESGAHITAQSVEETREAARMGVRTAGTTRAVAVGLIDSTRVAARAITEKFELNLDFSGALDVEWEAAWKAEGALNEILGARFLREAGKPFRFLPLFSFADPGAVLAAD